MSIKTPSILPGEPGWEEYQKAKQEKKIQKKQEKKVSKKRTPTQVGNIVLGKGFRFGIPFKTYKGETKYYVWKFKTKIAEITETTKGEISLEFFRFKKIGNYRDLINDADFQVNWKNREEELKKTQPNCYLCGKVISKSAKPNIYHYNMFKKKSQILEDSESVAAEVVSGKLTIEEGWEKFNDILEEGNRYYMSLKDTALICASCAKEKQVNY